MALWRSRSGGLRLKHGMRPLTPHALGSHAIVVALHTEGMEAVFGGDHANRLSLTVDNAVPAPTSSGYHLANPGGDPRLLVVSGTRRGGGRKAPGIRAARYCCGGGRCGGHVRGPCARGRSSCC